MANQRRDLNNDPAEALLEDGPRERTSGRAVKISSAAPRRKTFESAKRPRQRKSRPSMSWSVWSRPMGGGRQTQALAGGLEVIPAASSNTRTRFSRKLTSTPLIARRRKSRCRTNWPHTNAPGKPAPQALSRRSRIPATASPVSPRSIFQHIESLNDWSQITHVRVRDNACRIRCRSRRTPSNCRF